MLVLAYLSRHVCATLEELSRDLGLTQSSILSACSRLHSKGYITYKWLRVGGTRKRLYCINTTFLKEIHAQ